MTQFVRWVPKQHAAKSLELGLLSHNKSAKWIFDLSQAYRPGQGITSNSWLIAYDMDATAISNILEREHIDFEHHSFEGEGKHPTKIITKNNEPGAYGLGVMRQGITNHHVKARYATKAEVAKALKCREIEVSNAFRPGKTWP